MDDRLTEKLKFDQSGIHTVQMTLNGVYSINDFLPEHREGIMIIRTKINREEPKKSYTTIIDNHHKDPTVEHETFGDFETHIQNEMDGVGAKNYRFDRVDMYYNSFDPEHYHKYEKLYRLLVAGISISNDAKNNYQTMDLFSPVQISVATKTAQIEAEHYDRQRKNIVIGNKLDPTCSRFEIRSKKWEDQDIRREFTVSWFRRFDAAVEARDFAEDKFNQMLLERHREQVGKFPRMFTNIYEFLMIHRDYIYSRQQLMKLLEMIDTGKKITSIANNFKSRYGIDYVTDEELNSLVTELKRATKQYFES